MAGEGNINDWWRKYRWLVEEIYMAGEDTSHGDTSHGDQIKIP